MIMSTLSSNINLDGDCHGVDACIQIVELSASENVTLVVGNVPVHESRYRRCMGHGDSLIIHVTVDDHVGEVDEL